MCRAKQSSNNPLSLSPSLWLCLLPVLLPQMSKFFKIPLKIMPEVKPSGHYFGEILDGPYKGIPITAVSHAGAGRR